MFLLRLKHFKVCFCCFLVYSSKYFCQYVQWYCYQRQIFSKRCIWLAKSSFLNLRVPLLHFHGFHSLHSCKIDSLRPQMSFSEVGHIYKLPLQGICLFYFYNVVTPISRYVCHFTVYVFDQSLKFVFFPWWLFLCLDLSSVFLLCFQGKLPTTGMTITKMEDSENHKNAFEISGINQKFLFTAYSRICYFQCEMFCLNGGKNVFIVRVTQH